MSQHTRQTEGSSDEVVVYNGLGAPCPGHKYGVHPLADWWIKEAVLVLLIQRGMKQAVLLKRRRECWTQGRRHEYAPPSVTVPIAQRGQHHLQEPRLGQADYRPAPPRDKIPSHTADIRVSIVSEWTRNGLGIGTSFIPRGRTAGAALGLKRQTRCHLLPYRLYATQPPRPGV